VICDLWGRNATFRRYKPNCDLQLALQACARCHSSIFPAVNAGVVFLSAVAMIKQYVDRYNQETEFHFDVRRVVSTFYQEVAVLSASSPKIRRAIYDLWSRGDLRIITDVLLLLEVIAVPVAIGKKTLPVDEKGFQIRPCTFRG
jgi:hypothetical protein